jgi:polysaccharide export outer membrane protein
MYVRLSRLVGAAVIGTIGIALAGCGFFPIAGPTSIDVWGQAQQTVEPYQKLHYAVVKFNPDVVATLAHTEPAGLAGAFRSKEPPPYITFGIGDVVSVTIFEAAAGGLFIPAEAGVRPGNFVTLPDQTVDNDGNISIPYAGTIKAAGRTNVQIQNDIIDRIKNRAIDPQVVVAQTQQRTSLISVFGEVNTPVRYPAAAAGALDRVTDAITRAGGIKGEGYGTWVTVERHGRTATVPFANLEYQPANNIYVQPGDRIYVYTEQQKFIAFGATGQQGEFTFDAWRINLAEAVGKAGGLIDGQANPGSVFLYRQEPRDVAEQLGVDVTAFDTGDKPADLIPVIFSVSFQDPGGYFLATKVQMRNQDVLFVANAEAVEVTKFANFINLMTSVVGNGTSAASDVLITKQNFQLCCTTP